jgi:hypothetical protein
MVKRIAKGKWYSNYLTSMVDPLVRKMSIILRSLISMCIDVSRRQDLMLISLMLLMYVSELDLEVLPPFQIIRHFGFFRSVVFFMHLDVHYV